MPQGHRAVSLKSIKESFHDLWDWCEESRHKNDAADYSHGRRNCNGWREKGNRADESFSRKYLHPFTALLVLPWQHRASQTWQTIEVNRHAVTLALGDLEQALKVKDNWQWHAQHQRTPSRTGYIRRQHQRTVPRTSRGHHHRTATKDGVKGQCHSTLLLACCNPIMLQIHFHLYLSFSLFCLYDDDVSFCGGVHPLVGKWCIVSSWEWKVKFLAIGKIE